jgi:hypothetical protein
MIQKLQLDPNLFNNIWFSDESHFYLDGHCNKQNMRIWGSEKPEKFIEKSAHPLYVTVWRAISAQGLIGPIFSKIQIKRELLSINRIIEI